jgi:peptide/nickel transport system permease protein
VLARFILRRLGLSLLTLALLSIVVFVGVQVLPGDTARAILGPLADPRAVEALNRQLGTDRPALTLYVEWIAKLLSGDLGQSYIYRAPVASFIGPALLNSLKLAAMVFAIVVPLAIGAGVLAALNAGRPLDRAISVGSLSLTVIPEFVSSIALILVFAVWLGWLPFGGFNASLLTSPGLWLKQMILPIFVLGTGLAAILMRQTRAALLEVMREQYILTARSKGLEEKWVILRHAMKNSLLPVVTIASLQFGTLIGGTVVTETVFTLPGVGKFVVDAVIQRDYLVVQMGLLVLTIGVMLSNFAADIIYTYLDPRIRYD